MLKLLDESITKFLRTRPELTDSLIPPLNMQYQVNNPDEADKPIIVFDIVSDDLRSSDDGYYYTTSEISIVVKGGFPDLDSSGNPKPVRQIIKILNDDLFKHIVGQEIEGINFISYRKLKNPEKFFIEDEKNIIHYFFKIQLIWQS